MEQKNVCTQEHILRACVTGEVPLREVEKIGETCQVTAAPSFINVWPFTKLTQRDRICERLLLVNTKKMLKQTLDESVLARLAMVTNQPLVQTTDYDGYLENGIFALLFLLKRNRSECVVLAKIKDSIERILQYKDMTLERLAWADIGLYWSDGILTVPGGQKSFVSKSKECLSNNSTRFVLSLLTVVSDTNAHHANILMYDKVTGFLERFDPYQVQLEVFRTVELDAKLHELFKSIAGSQYKKFIKPIQLSETTRVGLQQKAENENEQTYRDPIGFCQPWTVLYADARMALPNQDPASIAELLEIMATSKHLSLTQFIRNYADNLQEVNNRVYVNFLLNHPEYKRYKDTRIPMYALFLQELVEYATIYT